MMLTIKELSRTTGISAYEIRRRVHNGTLPHTRVGAKQTKILINEDVFKKLLADESVENMTLQNKTIITANTSVANIGYNGLRKID